MQPPVMELTRTTHPVCLALPGESLCGTPPVAAGASAPNREAEPRSATECSPLSLCDGTEAAKPSKETAGDIVRKPSGIRSWLRRPGAGVWFWGGPSVAGAPAEATRPCSRRVLVRRASRRLMVAASPCFPSLRSVTKGSC